MIRSVWLSVFMMAGPAIASDASISRDQLMGANYRTGMVAFQQRCSACHSLAQGANHLAGPNLHGLFGSKAGSREGFAYSAALAGASFNWRAERLAQFISEPERLVPGTSMALPEPVPETDRIALISFVMLETGAADWPKPAPPRPAHSAGTATNAGADAGEIASRFPSFWNHLMTNTTRYRLQGTAGEFRFDAYFNVDGSVGANLPGMRGFWRVDERDFFCYAIYDLPVEPKQFVECFPIVAMSIPRFREDLWTTTLSGGQKLTGGIVAGRPTESQPAARAAK